MITLQERQPTNDIKNIMKSIHSLHQYLEYTGTMTSDMWCKFFDAEQLFESISQMLIQNNYTEGGVLCQE